MGLPVLGAGGDPARRRGLEGSTGAALAARARGEQDGAASSRGAVPQHSVFPAPGPTRPTPVSIQSSSCPSRRPPRACAPGA